MKILITGATGFLGKWVLKLLLDDPSVTQVTVVSRSKSSHPDARVKIIRKDLSDPSLLNLVTERHDAAIHLAGLYRFGSSYADNYESNVLGTQTLLEALRKFAPSRILFASTYAVGIGTEHLANSRLPTLPPRGHAYAHTKALAERLLEAQAERLGHEVEIFRLGILVGDSIQGVTEKQDGPYGFYGALRGLARIAPSHLPLLIPADAGALLPLVAVDEAAHAIIEALKVPAQERRRYHAVFRTDSITTSELMSSMADEIRQSTGKRIIPVFKSVSHPIALKAIESVVGSAAENFLYAQWKGTLEGDATHHAISHWSSIKKSFFAGVLS